VKEQLPDKEYDLKFTAVTFSDGSDPFISIDFEREVDGWIFRLQGGNKVQKVHLPYYFYYNTSGNYNCGDSAV
jgi:hypothetical protein